MPWVSFSESRVVKCTTLNFLYPLQDGITALFMASQEGHAEVVRILLQSGAQDMPRKVRTT